MKSALFSLFALCIPTLAVAQTTTFSYADLTVELPAGYTVQETQPDLRLAEAGLPEPALLAGPASRAVPEYDDLSDAEDVYPYLKLHVLALTPPDNAQTASQLSDRVFTGFRRRWGKFAFYYLDDERQTGRMVNVAGAFIALHVARCGDRLIVVEGLDYGQMRVFYRELDGAFLDLPESERWRLTRAGSNAADADALIVSVCNAIG